MSKVFYIGAPALVGLVLLFVVSLCFAALQPKDRQVKLSYWLALAQAAFALVAVTFTTLDPISKAACLTGIFGTFAMLALAALDTINLCLWFARRVRARDGLTLPLVFILLRLLTHVAFTASLWWCAQLCTV